MILLYILACLVFIVGSGLTATTIVASRQHKALYGVKAKELEGTSWVGKQLVKEYNALPDNHRPYANIKTIVKALDTKYGVDKVNNHFTTERYDSNKRRRVNVPSWEHRGCYPDCSLPEYKDIHESFIQIEKALAEQQYKFAVAGVSDALHAAADLTTRLREERDLIRQVTKELM